MAVPRRTTYAFIISCVILLFLSALYPPWVAYTHTSSGNVIELPYGYDFLFTLPEPKTPNVSIKIDFTALFLDWTVAIAGLAACFALQRKTAQPDPDERDQITTPGTS